MSGKYLNKLPSIDKLLTKKSIKFSNFSNDIKNNIEKLSALEDVSENLNEEVNDNENDDEFKLQDLSEEQENLIKKVLKEEEFINPMFNEETM